MTTSAARVGRAPYGFAEDLYRITRALPAANTGPPWPRSEARCPLQIQIRVPEADETTPAETIYLHGLT